MRLFPAIWKWLIATPSFFIPIVFCVVLLPLAEMLLWIQQGTRFAPLLWLIALLVIVIPAGCLIYAVYHLLLLAFRIFVVAPIVIRFMYNPPREPVTFKYFPEEPKWWFYLACRFYGVTHDWTYFPPGYQVGQVTEQAFEANSTPVEPVSDQQPSNFQLVLETVPAAILAINKNSGGASRLREDDWAWYLRHQRGISDETTLFLAWQKRILWENDGQRPSRSLRKTDGRSESRELFRKAIRPDRGCGAYDFKTDPYPDKEIDVFQTKNATA